MGNNNNKSLGPVRGCPAEAARTCLFVVLVPVSAETWGGVFLFACLLACLRRVCVCVCNGVLVHVCS
jgi:hypothetical protein